MAEPERNPETVLRTYVAEVSEAYVSGTTAAVEDTIFLLLLTDVSMMTAASQSNKLDATDEIPEIIRTAQAVQMIATTNTRLRHRFSSLFASNVLVEVQIANHRSFTCATPELVELLLELTNVPPFSETELDTRA